LERDGLAILELLRKIVRMSKERILSNETKGGNRTEHTREGKPSNNGKKKPRKNAR